MRWRRLVDPPLTGAPSRPRPGPGTGHDLLPHNLLLPYLLPTYGPTHRVPGVGRPGTSREGPSSESRKDYHPRVGVPEVRTPGWERCATGGPRVRRATPFRPSRGAGRRAPTQSGKSTQGVTSFSGSLTTRTQCPPLRLPSYLRFLKTPPRTLSVLLPLFRPGTYSQVLRLCSLRA